VKIIRDLLTDAYTIKSKEILSDEGLELTVMEYNSLITAIPKAWLKKLRDKNITFSPIIECSVKINGNHKHLSAISCKEYYTELVTRIQTEHTALRKWEEQYFYVDFNWSDIHYVPYVCARETAVQSLHFQIINRYYPCGEILGRWYDHESKYCVLCVDVIDSIEHYFYNCASVKRLWVNFFTLFRTIYDVHIQLGCLDVIFGLTNGFNETILTTLNFCIMQGKMFIKRCKRNEESILLDNFRMYLKKRCDAEKLIMCLQGKEDLFNETLGPLCAAL
jgi:hypothetical protein